MASLPCLPTPQGKTVVDPSYRAALELAPGSFESAAALPPAVRTSRSVACFLGLLTHVCPAAAGMASSASKCQTKGSSDLKGCHAAICRTRP